MQNSFLFTQDIPNYDMLEQIFFFFKSISTMYRFEKTDF